MPNRRLAAMAALLCLPFGAGKLAALDTDPPAPSASHGEPAAFSVVVSAPAAEISATCEEGCSWERVSASYPRGVYRITDSGIQPVLEDEPAHAEASERSGFSFVVDTTGKGISAVCEHGCAWKTISARYPMLRYRITERGIAPTR